MKYVLAALAAMFVIAVPAQADPPEHDWICHGVGNGGYVLLDVPTNSAHFTKHLPDGDDKTPLAVEGGLTCGAEDSDPTPPFTGKLLFTLDTIECEGTLVPGFTVTQLPGHHIQVEFVQEGVPQETVIFTFPPTCVPGATAVTNTTTIQQTTNTSTPVRRCRSKRVFTIRDLPSEYKAGDKVRARVGGKVQRRTVTKKQTIRVSFVGRKAGIYAVVIRAKKHPRVDRLYAICGAGNVQGYNVP